MLKPVEALLEYGKNSGLTPEVMHIKQEKLLDVLMHPRRSDKGRVVIAMFAHGAEAMRVAGVKEDESRYPHWAVQSWSVKDDDWITQKTYEMKPGMRDIACVDAQSWYAVPKQAEALAKWSEIGSTKEGVLESLIDSRAKLAEFWYETKVVDWNGRYDGEPWSFMSEVAATAFERDGHPDIFFGEKHAEKVSTQLVNFAFDWGELTKPILSGSLRRAGTNIVEAIIQYSSVEDAVDAIRASGHDAVLRSGTLGEASEELFLYSKSASDGLSREQVIKSVGDFIEGVKNVTLEHTEKEDSFLISLSFESWTDEELEAGETNDRGMQIERELIDTDGMRDLNRKYGISSASASNPLTTPNIWFNSTTPDQNRDYFEKGIQTFYSLHIHEVNGKEPEAEDYQRIANLIGVKFDQPLRLMDEQIEIITPSDDEKPIYGYYINLDERGDFQADVRDSEGVTVYEIQAGVSLSEGDSSIFEDGYMRHKDDISGLTTYLREILLIPHNADILAMSDFEAQLEDRKQSSSDFSMS